MNFLFMIMMVFSISKIFKDFYSFFFMLLVIEIFNLVIVLGISCYMDKFSNLSFFFFLVMMVMGGSMGLSVMIKLFRFNNKDMLVMVNLI